ncbi:hypothetical protein L202_00695 [Cryptococcus amylolentus CBS 6039]|uniref:Uncharacterized protein n=2 Tax=Cryptococcus amylolentus TaxID=104669 RepID=A0A1E3I8B0_9TREE|nr:hypothetical protein L202_00695 [Cryptococcus amylolentus CBS 6039]ODN84834.1 hypothetical protein L202_00695 [Cryptococcus amylolentus CBS 6039]ODO11449.1 hypothetical protein I350_00229 [Cryptococcus amylolentus CBS 6273]
MPALSSLGLSLPRRPLSLRHFPQLAPRASSTTAKPTPRAVTRGPVPRRPVFKDPSKPTVSNWPWRQVKADTPHGFELERTLFARPPDINPRMLSLITCLMGLMMMSFVIMPPKKKRDPTPEEIAELEAKAAESNIFFQYGVKVGSYIFPSANAVLGTSFAAALIVAHLFARRIITRLTQVQSAPNGPISLRITTVGHQVLDGTMFAMKPRKVETKDCSVYFLDHENATTVRLRVLQPNGLPYRWTLDRYAYSLDFRRLKDDFKAEGQEIVLSVPRLDYIFGKVGQGMPRYSSRK